MIRSALAATLLASAACTLAQAQTNRTNCTPQPECRIFVTPLQPGAPTTGLNPQGQVVKDTDVKIIFDRTDSTIKRDTFRMPASPP